MLRELALNRITDHLGRIKHQVSLRNSIHLFDINIHSEEFFKDLLNKIHGYQLENLNNNFAFTESIDLGDSNRGIAFQVTSDKSKRKINETIKLFYENGTVVDYPILKVLLLGDKPKRQGLISYGDFKFDLKVDVIDFSDLIREIQKLEAAKISEIEQWIGSELENNKFGTFTPPTNADFDRYFNKFLNSEIDSNTLLFNAQPSLGDCRQVFSDEYYLLIHQMYSVFYFSMLERGDNMNDKVHDKDVYHVSSSDLTEIKDKNHKLPGGMSEIAGELRPGKFRYHSISFKKRSEQYGMSFSIWIFLNGRWVFFPKPWRLVLGIKELKNHQGLKALVRIMSFFGIRIKGPTDQAGAFASLFIFSELAKK